ncbi:MAG TPA: hypothetical protein VKV74_17920 [Bryobacteraceae bacterium]|nr:hypothetical protein [Bryobacteraceae bacterium]
MKSSAIVAFSLICFSALSLAQSSTPAQANPITPQILAEMLRSAASFHDLVQNLNKSLGPDVHTPGPDGVPQHSMERTAATIGAGAGVGAAIGGMTRNPNGAMIGAMIGGAGGLILDQILRRREETHLKPADAPAPGPGLIPR